MTEVLIDHTVAFMAKTTLEVDIECSQNHPQLYTPVLKISPM